MADCVSTKDRPAPPPPVAGAPTTGRQAASRRCDRIGRDPGQVRGILAERVIISTDLDPFLTLKALAGYSGIGVRKLRDHLSDPGNPLPHYRVGAKILVRRSEFDAWMTGYRMRDGQDVAAVVEEVLRGLDNASS